jgi:hypothetical protein
MKAAKTSLTLDAGSIARAALCLVLLMCATNAHADGELGQDVCCYELIYAESGKTHEQVDEQTAIAAAVTAIAQQQSISVVGDLVNKLQRMSLPEATYSMHQFVAQAAFCPWTLTADALATLYNRFAGAGEVHVYCNVVYRDPRSAALWPIIDDRDTEDCLVALAGGGKLVVLLVYRPML